jgi:dihydropteroate synthase
MSAINPGARAPQNSVVIRVEEAGLGEGAQVRLVVSGVEDPERLHRPWASSGATIERLGDRMRATTTVEALARAAGRTLAPERANALDEALRRAVAAWAGPTPAVALPGGDTLDCDRRPLVMGIVNVTPDSFFDGGALYPGGHPDRAVEHCRALVEQGADVLDIGGESSHPGADPVPAAEEAARVVPVIERLAGCGVPLSIDTTKPDVAAAGLAAGAEIVNDVSGARTSELLDVVAGSGAAYVLMHSRGTPVDMQSRTAYDDVVAEVYEFLAEGLARCEAAGIPRERVLVDPGIGFAKTAGQSLALVAALRQFRGLGRPVLVGASRKSFIGAVLDSEDLAHRLEPSLGCAALAVEAGAAVLRVHDVAETVRVAKLAQAVAVGLDGMRRAWEGT